MTGEQGALGVLVGGGPAPGINGVISAVTLEAIKHGLTVVGIRDGFRWLAEGRTDRTEPLTELSVSRIHLDGGSILGTSRANPTKDPAAMARVIAALDELGVGMLATIGGDDTAFSAASLEAAAGGRIRVAHVPKTIDNDLPLPGDLPTFGFQTAVHEGVRVVRNLATDAQTTGRWYVAVTMGRKAGHLALGIGKAAGATMTMIPEAFDAPLRLGRVVDRIQTTILKRIVRGRPFGTFVLAEGLIEALATEDLSMDEVPRDDHGHPRLKEVPLGRIVCHAVEKAFAERGDKVTLVAKDIGYELRCADPVPGDMLYTRDLGYGAARFLLDGGSGAMITIQAGHLVPIPFAEIADPETGRTAVRTVDVTSQSYQVALEYMIRLEPEDLDSPTMRAKLAAAAKMSEADFVARFGYLVAEG